MPRPKLKNVPASIRQKLLDLARERNQDFGLVLTRYALEKILFRIGNSQYRDVFVLKGALLFEVWTHQQYRPTRDADFLARGDNSAERFVQIFREIAAAEVEDDGLRFDPKTVKAERITEDADYEGVRVTYRILLGEIRSGEAFDLLQLLNTGHSGLSPRSTRVPRNRDSRASQVVSCRAASNCRTAP